MHPIKLSFSDPFVEQSFRVGQFERQVKAVSTAAPTILKKTRTAAAFRSAGVFFFLTFVVVSHPSSTCSHAHGSQPRPANSARHDMGACADARHCNTDNSAHLSLRQASATSAPFLAVLLLL